MARGRVYLHTNCTKLQSRISAGIVYGIAVIRSIKVRQVLDMCWSRIICVLEGVAEDDILLIHECASGMT
jgi:hypothetical protein